MKTVGILGGMGPAATVDLFDRIVRATPARRDQDHLPVLILNDPSIPDRTAAILHRGPDPLPKLRAGIDRLARMGADFVVIPCNTAHHYLPALRATAPIPVLDMILETARSAAETPSVEVVGILATSGTLATGLYQRALEQVGLTPLVPNEAETVQLMEAIYGARGVKAAGATPEAQAALRRVGANLLARQADALILGCTEIPLALHRGDLQKEGRPAPLIASNQVLAEAAVGHALA